MHEGHRRRMYERVKNGDRLYEHEILEILLYNAYPRINTNPIAHALLNRFSSISAIFNADVDELCDVDGVGENVALYLKTVGLCAAQCGKSDSFAVIRNRGDMVKFISSRFKGKTCEILEFYGMDKNNKIIRIYSYSDNDITRVAIDRAEIARVISKLQPYGVFMAHNHTLSDSKPSGNDDEITAVCVKVCKMTEARFYDHLIYASDTDVFSYYDSRRLDEIRNGVDGGML